MKFTEIQSLKIIKRTRQNKLLKEPTANCTSSVSLGNFLIDEIGNNAQESLVLVAFNAKMHIVAYGEVYRGGVTEAHVEPADIFKRLLLSNATNFILAHNHPGGSLNMSEADVAFKDRMKAASEIMKLKFLDFMVVNDSQYHSARETKEF